MEGGQLLSYLRASSSYDFTGYDLVDMSFDILKGCVFLEEKNFEYVLLGLITSDPIERRFGWYRQLGGANYYLSPRQFFESEKKIQR